MFNLQAVIPTDPEYVTLEDLLNQDNEIIFIQHADTFTKSEIEEAFYLHVHKKHSKKIKLADMGDSPCYPVGFGNNEMHVIKKFDKYFVAYEKEQLKE